MRERFKTEAGSADLHEALADCLRKKKADFIPLSALPPALKKRLTGKTGASASDIRKAVAPHLGDLALRQGGRSVYLALGGPGEFLLLRAIQARPGKVPSANNLPFRKDEYLALLNRLIERGEVRVRLNRDYRPVLFAGEQDRTRSAQDDFARGETDPGGSGREGGVSLPAFRSAFTELERGDIYVDLFALRRRLGWPRDAFDAMLRSLRDAGTIQLHAGDATTMTPDEIADGFVDENGFRMGSVTWEG
ncbi:MAG: hypothetical protein LBL51_03535 [Synergistaceae bacterium]|jgi:hypothetical protein|nr:hypothetical protein [Synergistaceae bacterium]